MSKLTKALTAAAGNAGGESLYVEDVFSTYLYDGTGAAQTITNGIDLDGEGGLVWGKSRSQSSTPFLTDTERGTNSQLATDRTNLEYTRTDAITSFNSDGFTLGINANLNGSGRTQVAWTFRKAEKFFDVVTYTGDGVEGRVLNHSLNSTPKFIIIKATDGTTNWTCHHASVGFSKVLYLNSADAQANGSRIQAATDTTFTVSSSSMTNSSALSYVAYLFASDAGGFGDDGSESIIKCGEFSVDGSYEADVDCGFEPQWVLIKPAENTASWNIYDTMRGAPVGGDAAWLAPDLSQQEAFTANRFNPTATGFHIGNYGITAGNKIIYIAIRRPMKTPESGTEVFAVDEADSGTNPNFYSGFPVDVSIRKFLTNSTQSPELETRLTNKKLETAQTSAENATDSGWWDWQDGVSSSGHGAGTFAWMFKRATGFFDVVAYTGDGTNGRTVTHNLGAFPEMMWVKNRSGSAENWFVYHSATGATKATYLNGSSATATSVGFWNDTAPTSSVFSTYSAFTNVSSNTYIAYLFASVDGVSKVGSYTGTGSNVNVDCGFSAGARFILIKRTDSTGDWYVWDSERGIVAGNDPYLLLNSTAAEVTSTDYIDPLSSGFTVTSSAPAALNASGGSYIFLAIS